MHDRCGHCPVSPSLRCAGEGAVHLCDRADISNGAYRPGYARVLVNHAHPRLPDPIRVDYGLHPPNMGSCCGGGT